MKTRIKMSEPTYIVKSSDGIVVCKIKATSNIDCLAKNINMYSIEINRSLRKKFNLGNIGRPLTFTAVAKLHSNDTWNETTGKRIAESKCKQKIYYFYERVYAECLKLIKPEVLNLEQVYQTVTNEKIKEIKHLIKLTK